MVLGVLVVKWNECFVLNEVEVTAFGWKNRGEFNFYGIAQFFKHVGVVSERRGLFFHPFVMSGSKSALAFTVLVDVLHMIAVHVETQSQVI